VEVYFVATVVGLDEIREDAQRQFGDLDVTLPDGETVRLRHALRLSKADRKRLAQLGEQVANAAETEDEDALVAACGKVLTLVADSKDGARALLAAIKGDLMTLMGLIKRYQEVCQLPESSRSTS
jgi:tail assembly protein